MKMKYYIVLTMCLAALEVTAQPVITHNGNAPQIGESYNYAGSTGSFEPGAAGANQTWEFSSISPSFTFTSEAVNPVTTPYADNFPEANIAFSQSENNETFIYNKITNSEMQNVGLGNLNNAEGGQLIIHYTDPVKLMQ